MRFAGCAEDWHPGQDCGMVSTHELTSGRVIAWEYMPWRVVGVWERPFDRWPREYVEAWENARAPRTRTGAYNLLSAPPAAVPGEWNHRPMTVAILPDDAPPTTKPNHYLVQASVYWRTLPEHYALCHRCGQIPPCKTPHQETLMKKRREEMEKVMALMPGCCLGCGEPVTARQKTITFSGPNLIRPDFGEDTALFHARRSCYAYVDRYDRRWATATGQRRRFYCDGFLTVHTDGTLECTANPGCPGDVNHACTVWHHRQYAGGTVWSGCWCVATGLAT